MLALAAVAMVGPLLAQAPGAAASPPPLTAPANQAEALARMPWFTRLGLRALDVESKLPVRDQVVLVPDEAAFLEEVARWTPRERWPVLIEDMSFAPRFVRAFKPSQVLRRAGGTPAPADAAALRSAVDGALARAWGGDPAAGSAAAMRAVGLVPAGIVAASTSDPAWVAALALAAGRGQPIAWIEQPLGTSANDVVDAASFTAFDTAVRSAFETSGMSWTALGDDLDTFTLCRRVANRVT
ncbi:MAG: hypothetical protein ACKOTD_02975, partial [Phycisphaerales bacterium]